MQKRRNQTDCKKEHDTTHNKECGAAYSNEHGAAYNNEHDVANNNEHDVAACSNEHDVSDCSSIYCLIDRLLSYGLNRELIECADVTYVRNSLYKLFGIEHPNPEPFKQTKDDIPHLESVLSGLLDCAVERGLIAENTIAQRDLFDSQIMGLLTPFPSQVIQRFWSLYKRSPQEACNWYYRFSQDTNYIRRYRIDKDIRWKHECEYGTLDITINLSKPEKDPRDIARARGQKSSSYPACCLCRENEGFAGTVSAQARCAHRLIPLILDSEQWYLQYSPYVYFQEHCIVLSEEHRPMCIDRSTFKKFVDFLSLFPHYLIGSNADLPIVGGSILNHEHFQGGTHSFALKSAQLRERFEVPGYEDVSCGIVHWPLSVVRLRGKNSAHLVDLATKILDFWRNYSDEEQGIISKSAGEEHNTISPIAYYQDDSMVFDLILRCNITSEAYPDGVFHPHPELHHIKRENIGLIEAMGLAILPPRLKADVELIVDILCAGGNPCKDARLSSHAQWLQDLLVENYCVGVKMDANEARLLLQKGIGQVFEEVLRNAGVFSENKSGQAAFFSFISSFIAVQ